MYTYIYIYYYYYYYYYFIIIIMIIIMIIIIVTSHYYCKGSLYIYNVYVVKLGILSSFMGISPERWQRLPHADPGQLIKSPEKKKTIDSPERSHEGNNRFRIITQNHLKINLLMNYHVHKQVEYMVLFCYKKMFVFL